MNKNNFFYTSLFIVLVNIITMLMDFYYNIMLSKFIGPEGIGLFQMATSILMVALVFSIGGIPTAVSKLVAEEKFKNNSSYINKILNVAIILVFSILGLIIVFLLIWRQTITLKIFKDENMIIYIYLLIPAIILISIGSVLRGYYYGLKMIKIPSVSQILECISKIFIVLLIFYYIHPVEPKYGVIIALAGISIGEGFNFFYLLIMKGKTKSKYFNNVHNPGSLNILSQISSIAIPIGISNLLAVLLRFANTLLIPKKLMEIGFSNTDAIATFGRIMGMAMPLITLPFMITSAMGIVIVPNLSKEMAMKNYTMVKSQILFSIKITLLFSIPLAGLYAFFPKSVALFLYNDLKLSEYICIMSCNTIFLSLQNALSNILYGLNKQTNATINKLIGASFQIFAIYFLVGNPRFGINGLFIGFYLSSLIICILNFYTLINMMKLNINYKDLFLKPIIGSIFMVFPIKFFLKLEFNMGYKTIFLLVLLLGCGIYLLTLYILKAI
ncbi:MAG: oligosaccharide flippase family protein [Tissierellia bacterium]|nr:oligosaccharide flippase family protein [Tissierellia bacterium]